MDKNKIKSLLNEGKSQNRLSSLLEELEVKATKKTDPTLKNPELKNSDLFASKAEEEVKEIIVENRKLSAKQKMTFLLEKYGVEALTQLAGEERSRFLKELNNPETKYIKASMLLETKTSQEMNADSRALNAKTNAEKVDVQKAKNPNGPHMTNEKEELDPEVESPDPEKDPEFDGEYDDDKELKDIDKNKGDDTIKTKNQALESVTESMESIFDILRDIPLNEDEVTGKGEEAMTDNEATKESDGEVAKPTGDNADTFPTDEHKQDEEVKGLVIEGEMPEALKKNMKDDKDDDDKTPEKLEDGSKDEDHDEKSDDDNKDDKKEDDSEDKKLDEGEMPEQFKKSEDKKDDDSDDKDDKKEEKSDDKDSKDDKKDDNKDESKEDKKDLDESEMLPLEKEKEVGTKETEKISDTIDSKGDLKPVEEVKPQLKNNEISAVPHDDADAEGKKIRDAVLEDVIVKGEVAKSDNEATKEEDGIAKEPTTTNANILPADEHEEKEEIEAIVIENAVQLSDDSVFITIPFNENEGFSKDLGDTEQALVQEALKVFYGVLSGRDLNESEDFEIPADSEADLKVYKEKIEIQIPINSPIEEINEEDAQRLQEALDVLDAILKEALGGIAQMAAPAAGGVVKKLFPDAPKTNVDVEKPNEVDNADLIDGTTKDDVEEVVVEGNTDLLNKIDDDLKKAGKLKKLNKEEKAIANEEVTVKGDAAVSDNEATKEVDGETKEPDADNKDLFPEPAKEEVEEVVVEDVTVKGDVAMTDNEATKETEGEKATSTDTNKELFPADEHKECEEVEAIVVEAETLPTDAQIKDAMDIEPTEKVEHPVEIKNGEVVVKPYDEADAEGKKVRDEVLEEEGNPEKADKLNNVNSDTLDDKGELNDPKPELEGKAEVKDVTTGVSGELKDEATVEDVTEGYNSIKEAFLLEREYFSKDSRILLTASEKRAKLENQMALLVARDSQDPLYEELVKTTILAKKLQETLQERYVEVAKQKSEELVSLKEGEMPEQFKKSEDKDESKDDEKSEDNEIKDDKKEDKKEEKSDDKKDDEDSKEDKKEDKE